MNFWFLFCSHSNSGPKCEFQHHSVNEQKTKCTEAWTIGNAFVCKYPVISYGNVDHGIPQKHGDNDYAAWCQEMGFDKEFTNGVLTEQRTIYSPQGWVFGCRKYDSSNWHWCDSSDGYWYNQRLNMQGHTYPRITEVKCLLKNNIVPTCLQGKHIVCIEITCKI